MATLMDLIMGRGDQSAQDYTLGSRANFQPTGQAYSRDGRLGNMGFRNMERAQSALAATGQPPVVGSPEYMRGIHAQLNPTPAETSPYGTLSPVSPSTDSTMMGFMPPDYSKIPPPPGDISQMYAGYRLPPASYADMYTGYTPPPTPAPQASYADMYAGYRLPPAAAPVAPPPAAAAVPMPPVRPMGIGQPTVRQTFLDRLLGPSFQSTGQPVVNQPSGPTESGMPMQPTVNWGDVNQAADFFRADQAARQLGLLG